MPVPSTRPDMHVCTYAWADGHPENNASSEDTTFLQETTKHAETMLSVFQCRLRRQLVIIFDDVTN